MTVRREGSWEALGRGEPCDARWPEYGEYAALRTQGLRSQALAAADRCAATLTAADQDTRWAFTTWLFSQVLVDPTIRTMALPHPLESLVLDELWQAHEHADPQATSWLVRWFPADILARTTDDPDGIGEFLRGALRSRPGDEGLRQALARHLVAWVRTDSADVAHGRYDGDPDADLRRLDEARDLLGSQDPMVGEIDALRRTVRHWRSAHPAGEFPESGGATDSRR